MGLLQGLAGNSQEVTREEARAQYGPWLLPGEEIHSAYRLVRDGFCVTTQRVIIIDRQGVTGNKTRVKAIDMRSIVAVTAETAGWGVDDSELEFTYIVSPNRRAPTVERATYRAEFPRNFDISALYRYFAQVAWVNVSEINA